MKADRPFRSRLHRGVLHLALDTPRAAVNIFDRPAADQLTEIFEALPSGLRAVVFESAKPASFINGVGLMMASAVSTLDSARKIAGPIVRAFDLVERAPVPTIAAIRGSCFGCGVEFALRCTHRLAAVGPETQFYMTELNDYLFSPAFGGISKLRALIGLDRSADFLLWGERWSTRDALRVGLIDRAVREASFATAIEETLKARPRRRKRASPAGAIVRHRERIDRLPPAHQSLYRSVLRLMAASEDRERELALSAETAAAPIAKRALGFFFVRQVATELCRRTEGGGRTACAGVEPFERRAMTGAPIADELPMIYRPDRRRSRPLVEVAVARDQNAGSLVEQVELDGAVAFVSRPQGTLASDSLLVAHLAPLLRSLAAGTTPRTINQTLRGFGFVERPHHLLARFRPSRLFAPAERKRLRALEDDRFARGRSDPRLLDELCLSWLACARALLGSGTIEHPAILDLAARELLGFPLEHGSLCSHLTRARVARAMVNRSTPEGEAYLASKRDFYA